MIDIVEFAKTGLGIELLPYQIEWLQKMENKKVVILAPRRPGRVTLEKVWDEYQQFKKLSDVPSRDDKK